MAYVFPFTTTGELNLDWLLGQVAALNQSFTKLEQHNTKWTEEIKKSVHLLQTYNESLMNLMNFFPAGSFSFDLVEYTIADVTIDNVISNLRVAKNLSTQINEAVGADMQRYVDECLAIERRISQLENIGEYVSYAGDQSLTGTQKSVALANIGLTPPNIMFNNMFNLETLKCGQLVKTTTTSTGFKTLNGHAECGTYDLYTGTFTPNANMNERFRFRTGARFFGCNYTYASENNPSTVIYMAQGYYTVSCKVRILNTDFNFPSRIIMTGAVKHGNATDAPSGYNNYCNYTNSQISASYNVYGTATRGETGVDAHVFNENNEAYFKKTFYVPTNGEWSPAFCFQWSNNTLASAYPFGGNVEFSEIQIEVGEEVTEYKPFASGVVIQSNTDTTEIQAQIDTLKQAIWHDQDAMLEDVSQHLKDLDTNGLSDSMLFFTDCHPSDDNGESAWQQRVYSILGIMTKASRSFPANHVFNGGDWLLSTSPDFNKQVGRLSYIYGLGDQMLGSRMRWVLGNHDFNVNDTSQIENVITQSAIGAVFPEPYSYYVIDEEMAPIAYMVYNTSIGSNSTAWWMVQQIKKMADYMISHPRDYIFLPHIFVHTFKLVSHAHVIGEKTLEDQSVVPLYGPEVTLMDGAVYNVSGAIANLAHAYNSKGTFTYQGMSWDFRGIDSKYKVRYILAGHLHKEAVCIYNEDVPVFMAGSFGYMAKSTSSPRPDPHYTEIINTVWPDDGNSSHYFSLVNPMQYQSTQSNHPDNGKWIQECNMELVWLAGTPEWRTIVE